MPILNNIHNKKNHFIFTYYNTKQLWIWGDT